MCSFPPCTPEQWAFIRERAVACAALPIGEKLLHGWPGLCGVLKHPTNWQYTEDSNPQVVHAAYWIVPKLFEKEMGRGIYFPGEVLTPLRLEILETLILWIDAGIAQELYEQLRADAKEI
jgi:hypothetical protein